MMLERDKTTASEITIQHMTTVGLMTEEIQEDRYQDYICKTAEFSLLNRKEETEGPDCQIIS